MKNEDGLVFAGVAGPEAAFGMSPRARIAFSALAVVAFGLAALLPTLAIAYWLFFSASVAHGVGIRIVAIVTALLHLLPMSWGLLRLQVCLRQFAGGRPFAAKGIAGLRDFALGIGASAVAKPVAGMLFYAGAQLGRWAEANLCRDQL